MDPTAARLWQRWLHLLLPPWLLAGFADWCCHRQQPPLPGIYMMALATATVLLVALPFAEDAWRCARTRRVE